LPTVTVNAPGLVSPATSEVTVSAATVTSGDAVTLTLQAKDAAGNNLTTSGSTVVFTLGSGTSTGTISAASAGPAGTGTYTATFTGLVIGSARTIGATINGNAVTSTLPTVTFNASGAVSAATSEVTVSSATVTSGDAVTLTLQAKDA